MRDKWYGDQLDLLKWGGMAQLVQQAGADLVIQVAYRRTDQSEYTLKTQLAGNVTSAPLSNSVVDHFKQSMSCIESLKIGAEIKLFAEPWSNGERDKYHEELRNWVSENRTDTPLVLLLDPDTGVKDDESATAVHVNHTNVLASYRLLRAGDVLAVYQHRPQGEGHADLLKNMPGRIAMALSSEGVTENRVSVIYSPDLPRNAVLASVKKH